jgi:phosphotransferase system  glucose/maltose/N-acetylglucosamine-specific IIC component
MGSVYAILMVVLISLLAIAGIFLGFKKYKEKENTPS